MKATDYRDTTFASLSRDFLTGARQTLYADLLAHGPTTTRALAERTGISIFTVRPRITELTHIGLAACVEAEGREGIYRALTEMEWCQNASSHQMQLL